MKYSFRRSYKEETPSPAIRASLCTTLWKTTKPEWDGLKQNTLCYRFAPRSGKCATDFFKLLIFFLPLFVFFWLPSSSCCCSWDRTLFFPLSLLFSWIYWCRPPIFFWVSLPVFVFCSTFLLVGEQFFFHSPLQSSVHFNPARYLHFLMYSSASLVLLLMYSTQSSSFSVESIASSMISC